MNPVEIDAFLKRDVLGQEESLRFVSVAIFKHLKGERFGNLMLIGNSGTGKTTIMRSMERLYHEHPELAQYRVVIIMNSNTFASDEGLVDTSRLFVRLEERARVPIHVDTGKMLFLCAGAFETLYDQVFERVTAPTSRVKLPRETVLVDGQVEIREYFTLRQHFKQEDLFDYGMQPQFLSRFDNSIILKDLDTDLLQHIFMDPDDSVFKTSQRFFVKYGIDLQITPEAVKRLAFAAGEAPRIGARALKDVYGRVIKPFEYDPFSRPEVKKDGDGHQLIIDETLVVETLNPET